MLNTIRTQQQYAQVKTIARLHVNQQIGSYQGRDPQTGSRIFVMADGSIAKARYLGTNEPIGKQIAYIPNRAVSIPDRCV